MSKDFATNIKKIFKFIKFFTIDGMIRNLSLKNIRPMMEKKNYWEWALYKLNSKIFLLCM